MMTDIKFFCTSCGKKLGIDRQAAGLAVPCPRCGTRLTVPHESQEPSAPPAPAADQALLEDLRGRIEALQEQNKVLTDEKASLQEARRKLEESGREELKREQENSAKIRAASEEAARRADVLAAERSGLAAELDREKAGRAELEQKLKQAQEEAIRLKSDLDAARTDREADEALRTEADALRDSLEKAVAEAEAGRRAAAEAGAARDGAEAKVRELEQALAEQAAAREVAVKAAEETAAGARTAGQVQAENEALKKERDRLRGEAVEKEGLIAEIRAAASGAEARAAELAGVVQSRVEEVERLKAEAGELKVHHEDARALSGAIAGLQAEIKSLREQEATLRKSLEEAERHITREAEKVKAAPAGAPAGEWAFNDPFRSTRKWLIAFAGVITGGLVCALLFVLFWPELSGERRAAAAAEADRDAAASARLSAGVDAVLDEPFEIDDVEVVVERAAVRRVDIISIVGNREKTPEVYLALDIRVTNRSRDRDLVMQRAWKGARMVDDRGRRLLQAFAEPVLFEEMPGMLLNRTLVPGESATDLAIFAAPQDGAGSFTLTVDPGFRSPRTDGSVEQRSARTIRLTFDASSLVYE